VQPVARQVQVGWLLCLIQVPEDAPQASGLLGSDPLGVAIFVEPLQALVAERPDHAQV
jgi:hypothetical protein